MHSKLETTSTYAPLLLITYENVGEKMAGPGIRAWELAQALGQHGVSVTLATPYESERQATNVRLVQYSWDQPESLAKLIGTAQVVKAAGPLLARIVHLLGAPIEIPVIADIYDVVEIERIIHHAISGGLDHDPTRLILDEMYLYLRQGDYFVCSSERQHDLWLGALLAVGRINSVSMGKRFQVNHLLGIVPMGLPKDPPQAGQPRLRGVVPGIDPADKILFWGGGIWDWTDPFTLIDALELILAQRQDVRLVFGALHHFDQEIVPGMSAAKRLLSIVREKGWLNRFVYFQDWVPYDGRGSYLLEADLGVSMNIVSIENRFAARARLLDYLWAGLPCVLSAGDNMTALLEEVGLAQMAVPGDPQGTARAILDALETSERQRDLEPYRAYQQPLAWPAIVQPILAFLQSPSRAADGVAARQQLSDDLSFRQEWERMKTENADFRFRIQMLEAEIAAYRQRKAVQFSDKLTALLQTWKIKK